MKKFIKHTTFILLAIILFNCSSDDDNKSSDQNPLLGKWETVSGSLVDGFIPKYIIFNNDNSVNLLMERELGFKNTFKTSYSVTQSDVTINLQGDVIYQYIIDGETLTITDGDSNTSQYQKNNSAPNTDDWVQQLSILNQGEAPWEGAVDIAFTYDKTKIVYGMNASATYIPLLSPETFEEVGQITAVSEARVVEIEKYNDPDRYIFQSSGDSDLISYYTVNNGIYAGNIEIASEISGLASVDEAQIWISENNDWKLRLYDYNSDVVVNEIQLDRQTYGLDYQGDYLFISDATSFHKCQINPDFQVMDSYSIPDTQIFGIAFDGTNFWVSGYNNNAYKLIKTNLTL